MPDPVPLTPKRPSFWKRAVAPEVTAGQIAFDVAAGILLPIVCLVMDPIVFGDSGLLARQSSAAYMVITLGLLNLTIWLLLRRPAYVMAGALAAGAVVSFLLGLLLLPYSVLGLMALIGVFGFAPFVTSFVFWRNSVRAYRLGRTRREAAGVQGFEGRLAAGAAFVLVLALPLGTQAWVGHEVARATEAAVSSGDLDTSLATLRRMRWLVDTDSFVWAYEKERSPVRRQRLADLYRSFAGRDIEKRLAKIMND